MAIGECLCRHFNGPLLTEEEEEENKAAVAIVTIDSESMIEQ